MALSQNSDEYRFVVGTVTSVCCESTARVRPHEVSVFEGLHGVFNDSLPDGWGRLLIGRRARRLGIEPETLTPLDRLACVGNQGIGALCYAPAVDVWEVGAAPFDLDRLAAGARAVLKGHVADVVSELGRAGGSPGGTDFLVACRGWGLECKHLSIFTGDQTALSHDLE